MDNWYYKLFGDEFGPVTFDALVELAKAQTLTAEDEVRFGENGPWRRAGSMGQLMTHMPAGAHMPSVSSSGSMPVVPSSGQGNRPQKADEPAGWYYQSFGEQFGPLSFEDLVVLAKNQTLSVDDEVKFGENGTWRRAGSIGQLMAHLPFQAGKNAFSIELENGEAESAAVEEDELDDPLIDMRVLESKTPPPANRSTVGGKKSSSATMKTVSPPSEPVTPAAPQEELWWCMISGKEYGPVDLPKLVAWAAAGRLLRNDFVRRGLESYIVAGELPGLFPELPPSASPADTKAEIKSVTRSMPTASAATPSSAPAAPVERPQPDSTEPVSKPATNWGASTGGATGAGFNRPVTPIRRPPAKGGSDGMKKLIVPIGAVVGVLLLGGLIYLLLPYIPMGETADQKNFKALRTAYSEIQKVRSQEGAPKPEEFKKAGEAMVKAAKKVDPALKAKTPAAARLKSLSKKIQDLPKEDLTKVGDVEKGLIKQFETLGKQLKVK